MKTPEEIMQGVNCIRGLVAKCGQCAYQKSYDCTIDVANDFFDLYKQLESSLAQAERERDAAVYDLAIHKFCHTCVEDATTSDYGSARCHACVNKSNWEWRRGVCPENTKEEK